METRVCAHACMLLCINVILSRTLLLACMHACGSVLNMLALLVCARCAGHCQPWGGTAGAASGCKGTCSGRLMIGSRTMTL